MAVTRSMSNNGGRQRQRRRSLSKEGEDKLSLLPDAIITDILSRLPITSAAATSILSRRWRHLWTGITSFHFDSQFQYTDSEDFAIIVIDILRRRLASPKLHIFNLNLYTLCKPNLAESWFPEICRRNAEQIIIHSDLDDNFFVHVPSFLFKTQSLVILELSGILKFDLLDNVDFQLPNLKQLHLRYLYTVPLWLETLCKSCTLLEILALFFDLCRFPQPQNAISFVNIYAPNLKSLTTEVCYGNPTRRTKFFINAPKLVKLSIQDQISAYYFLQIPTELVTARIGLSMDESYEVDTMWMVGEEEYLHQMSKFVGGMFSVSNLTLHLVSGTNILYSYLNSVDHGLPRIFTNLSYLNTSLADLGLVGWKDLLISMQCFPNLQHLQVNLDMRDNLPMERLKWCAPDVVPDCLVSKLKKIKVRGLLGIDDELKLLGYILIHATLLEALDVEFNIQFNGREARLWNACRFCKSLFELPRGSATCEILFCGGFIRASSNAFTNGKFTCQVLGLN